VYVYNISYEWTYRIIFRVISELIAYNLNSKCVNKKRNKWGSLVSVVMYGLYGCNNKYNTFNNISFI
jgi:hypothetical protein